MSFKSVIAFALLSLSLGACASLGSADRKIGSADEGHGQYTPTKSDIRNRY